MFFRAVLVCAFVSSFHITWCRSFFCLPVLYRNKKSVNRLPRTFHLHAGDVRCKTPLEQDVWVWRLVVTIQLPAYEVLSESLRTCGSRITFASISSCTVNIKWHRGRNFREMSTEYILSEKKCRYILPGTLRGRPLSRRLGLVEMKR